MDGTYVATAEVATTDARDVRIEHGPKARWLAPVAPDPPRKKVREKPNARRASNKGCLSMTLDEYLELLDWTGRQLKSGKTGSIPASALPILERLEVSPETWLDLIKNFRQRFRSEAGLPKTRQSFRSNRRQPRVTPESA